MQTYGRTAVLPDLLNIMWFESCIDIIKEDWNLFPKDLFNKEYIRNWCNFYELQRVTHDAQKISFSATVKKIHFVLQGEC